MSRIHRLDPHVVNKIAAGEVIERPASVVKELLENSVDALATRVEVDVAAGGTELIRVTDDGDGIHPDDLLPAVTSHSTSKLNTEDDLFRVHTLGFRGEALASMAAVSRLTLRSRQKDAESAYELQVDAGKPGSVQPCGSPAGTRIEVRHLFANTPVRRRFLKTTATEFGHLSEQFTRIALAHPRLHAVLRHNDNVVYELPPTDRLLDRLRLFYGSELAEHLIPVESRAGDVRLWGYVAHPSHSKSTRKGQYLFLNGRWIQDRSLQHALGEAYRGLLMTGRYPMAFLFLEMPSDLIDVNVHPTKSEVRFRDSGSLYRQLLSTIRTRFLSMELHTALQVRAEAADRPGTALPPLVDPQRRRELQTDLADWAKQQLAAQNTKFESFAAPHPLIPSSPHRETQPSDGDEEMQGTEDAGPPSAHRPRPVTGSEGGTADSEARAMQIHDSYLVVETEDGLTVIDQHALHERILYEQLRQRVLAGAVESQRMLVPETVELSPGEAAVLLEHREALTQLGFGLEDFGNNTVLLNGYPLMLGRADLRQLIRDVADGLAQAGKSPSRRDILDRLLHMMSCKAAIKAGHRLTSEEMESLIAQRHLVDDAHHCPHGRPTALVLSRAELDRQFGRI